MITSLFNNFFSLLLASASLLVVFEGGKNLTWSDVWIVLVSISFFLFSFKERKEDKITDSEKFNQFEVGSIVFGCLVILAWRYLGTSLWLDELSQFQNVDLLPRGLSLVRSAADQQQPPLDLYFQYLSQKILPAGEFSLRFFPMFFFVGSVLNLNELLKSLTKYKSLVFMGLILFIFNPLISYFSAEARPYSLAIFLAILFIRRIINLQKSPTLKSFVSLALSGAIFIASIGLQPVLIISSSLSAILLKANLRSKKGSLLTLALFFLLGFIIVYWPMVANSIDIKKVGFVSLKEWNDYGYWWKILRSYFSLNLLNIYSLVLSFFFFLSLFAKFFDAKLKEVFSFEIYNVVAITFLTGLCFIYFINWPYYEKFSVVSFLFVPMFFVRSLDSVLATFRKNENTYKAVQAIIMWIPFALILSHFVVQKSTHLQREEGWRAFSIEMLDYKNGEIKAFSFLDHLLPPIHTLFGSKVYLNEGNYIIRDNRIFQSFHRNVTDLQSSPESHSLVLAMPQTWSQDNLDNLAANALSFGRVEGGRNFRYWASRAPSDVVPFMNGLVWLYAGQPWSFSALESLLLYYSNERNTDMVQRIEDELWSLVSDHESNEVLGVKNLDEKRKEFFVKYFDELKKDVR